MCYVSLSVVGGDDGQTVSECTGKSLSLCSFCHVMLLQPRLRHVPSSPCQEGPLPTQSTNTYRSTTYPPTMSASSATTLISPATTTNSNTMQRSNSHHGHPHKARTHHGHTHGHGHHGHAKRRPSAHSAHTTGHLGTGRRGSEGDGGRKAIFSGLTMAAMDGKGKKDDVSIRREMG
jgi:hypothetical protein